MAKDKRPNLTLAVDTSRNCEFKGCENHAVKTRTEQDGTITRRCIWHPWSASESNDDYMLRFLGLI